MRFVVPGAFLVLAATALLPVESEREPHPAALPGWVSLEPAERRLALRNYCEFQALSAREQQQIQTRYERWKRLSEAERQEARRRWQADRTPPVRPRAFPVPVLEAEAVQASATH